MVLFEIMASLAYAFIDFIALEVIATIIFKVNKQGAVQLFSRRGAFKPTEYFVIGAIGLALFYFYLSNILQDFITLHLASLGWWLFPVLLFLSGFSSLWLCVVILGRTWSFRTTVVSLLLVIIAFLLPLAHWALQKLL